MADHGYKKVDELRRKPLACRIRQCRTDKAVLIKKTLVEVEGDKPVMVYEFRMRCSICNRPGGKKTAWEKDRPE